MTTLPSLLLPAGLLMLAVLILNLPWVPEASLEAFLSVLPRVVLGLGVAARGALPPRACGVCAAGAGARRLGAPSLPPCPGARGRRALRLRGRRVPAAGQPRVAGTGPRARHADVVRLPALCRDPHPVRPRGSPVDDVRSWPDGAPGAANLPDAPRSHDRLAAPGAGRVRVRVRGDGGLMGATANLHRERVLLGGRGVLPRACR